MTTTPYRSRNFQIRLNEAEWEAVRKRATTKPIAKWARAVLLNQPIEQAISREVTHRYSPELLRELRRISNGVNQIARVLNTAAKFNEDFSEQERLNMLLSLSNIDSFLREVLDYDH